jgi:hypothetical protein
VDFQSTSLTLSPSRCFLMAKTLARPACLEPPRQERQQVKL